MDDGAGKPGRRKGGSGDALSRGDGGGGRESGGGVQQRPVAEDGRQVATEGGVSEVDTQFHVVGERDTENDGFDHHLHGLHVKLRDHPIDCQEHALAILYDEHVGRTQRVAARLVRIGLDPDLALGRGGERAALGEQRLDHFLQVGTPRVVQMVDANGQIFAQVGLGLRIDINEVLLPPDRQLTKFGDRLDPLFHGQTSEVHVHQSGNFRRDQNIHLALATDDFEYLAHFDTLDVQLQRPAGQTLRRFVGSWRRRGTIANLAGCAAGQRLRWRRFRLRYACPWASAAVPPGSLGSTGPSLPQVPCPATPGSPVL